MAQAASAASPKSASSATAKTSAPCGGCRQRIREFADAETVVHVAGPEGVRARFTLRRTVAGILWPRPSSDRVKGGAHQRE